MANPEILDHKAQVVPVDVGIGGDARTEIAKGLSSILADSYLLLIKTHGAHWNTVGPLFYSLHKLTEEQYEELFDGIDELAERIRSLGHPAPASFEQFRTMSGIREETTVPSGAEMVTQLVNDHETIARRIREAKMIADRAEDEVTLGLLTDRLEQHEKAAWMLRSLLE